MPGALDGYSSSIVYKLTSLRYIFLYQVWLFTRPKLSRTCIQRAVVLHTVRFLPCLLEICAKCVEGQGRNFFPCLFCMHEFFWALRPSPPLPHNFSKGPPLSFLNKANKIVYSLLVELSRSLMYFNNRNGPRMEPCGNPQVTFFCVDLTLSYIYQFVFYWKGNFLFKHEICHENHRNKVNGYYDLPCQMLLVNQALTWQWIYGFCYLIKKFNYRMISRTFT